MTSHPQGTPIIVARSVAAISALVIGATVFLRRKGTLSHRVLGWTWVVLMAAVALLPSRLIGRALAGVLGGG